MGTATAPVARSARQLPPWTARVSGWACSRLIGLSSSLRVGLLASGHLLQKVGVVPLGHVRLQAERPFEKVSADFGEERVVRIARCPARFRSQLWREFQE